VPLSILIFFLAIFVTYKSRYFWVFNLRMDRNHDTSDSSGSPDRVVVSTYLRPQAHDADVKLEEYHYYAQRTREEGKTFEPTKVT
jgi:hypothetical protein